jgi:hypothetical protein
MTIRRVAFVIWAIVMPLVISLTATAGPAFGQPDDSSSPAIIQPSHQAESQVAQPESPQKEPIVVAQGLGPAKPPTVYQKPGQEPFTTGRSLAIESTPLEDLLLEKGLITMDDWIRIKAEEERRQIARTTESQFIGNPRWFERINVNGYAQFRYTTKSNSKLDIPLGESTSTNHPQDFFFRRIRMVFEGQVSRRIGFFFQAAHEGNGFRLQELELVDMRGDYYITLNKEHRITFGLHRIPNAFDTYRSSSQRQELDRAESVQSGAPGERDLGLAYYWSPTVAQQRFTKLATYHNGPGDYGVFGVMVFNGQGRSQTEQNKNKHIGTKLAWPFELPNGRLVETGVLGFMGTYNVQASGSASVGTLSSTTAVSRCPNPLKNNGCDVYENRITGYVWTPPQPWGFMGEYTLGRGPERNDQGVILQQAFWGGYGQVNYTWRYSDVGMLTPYLRYNYYHGGIKNLAAAASRNEMVNLGMVWEPDTHLRLVTEYMYTDRLNFSQMRALLPQERVAGQYLRFQIQWFWN